MCVLYFLFAGRSFNEISGDEVSNIILWIWSGYEPCFHFIECTSFHLQICYVNLAQEHNHCKERFPNEYFPEVKSTYMYMYMYVKLCSQFMY